MSGKQAWNPTYSHWRHGGWYVHDVRHIGGACGCVSNNYPDKKWRIVCDDRRNDLGEEGDFTFPSRDAAARAEYELAKARIAEELGKWNEIPNAGGYRQPIGEYEVHIISDFEGDFCVRVERAGKKIKVLGYSTGCFEQALKWAMDEILELRKE